MRGASRGGVSQSAPGCAASARSGRARLTGQSAGKSSGLCKALNSAFIASLAAPLPDLRFCPTGGIDLAKAPEYLKLPNVPCVGGSWMLQKAALASGDYLAVEALARDAAELKRAAA